MRLIATSTLREFGLEHPSARVSLNAWAGRIKAGQWFSMNDIQSAFPKAKVLNRERIRFQISGGDYRLIAAFEFKHRIAFVKFIGTHAEYDQVDALTVSLF